MRYVACIISLAAMFGTIDVAKAEEAQAPPRDTASLAAAAEAYASNFADEDRSQSPPNLDRDERRVLHETAPSQDADQIPTLLKAAHYLQEAGLQEEAAKVRLLAARRRAEWQALFDEKSAELKKLQADVDALRKALGDERQVQIDFKILAVSPTKLRTLGFDWANIIGVSGKNRDERRRSQFKADRNCGAPLIIDAGSPFFRVLELLGSRHAVKVVAEPSVATVSGREALFQVGEDPSLQPAAHDDSKPVSLFTRAEVLPTVGDDGRIHLKLKVRVGSDPGAQLHDEDVVAPTREVQAAAKLRPGQTLFVELIAPHRLADQVDSPGASEVKHLVEQFEYAILATPKLVELPVVAAFPVGPNRSAPGAER